MRNELRIASDETSRLLKFLNQYRDSWSGALSSIDGFGIPSWVMGSEFWVLGFRSRTKAVSWPSWRRQTAGSQDLEIGRRTRRRTGELRTQNSELRTENPKPAI